MAKWHNASLRSLDDAIFNAMAALIFCALILARRRQSGHERLHSWLKSEHSRLEMTELSWFEDI